MPVHIVKKRICGTESNLSIFEEEANIKRGQKLTFQNQEGTEANPVKGGGDRV